MRVLQDSLWAAEDIDAVFDQDPQRVCILQGPVAVKHSKVKDEPIKELLGNITSMLVDKLVDRLYGGDKSKIPSIEYLSTSPPIARPSIAPAVSGNTATYVVGQSLPDTSAWLETLAGTELNWLHAFLTSKTIVQGTAYIDNPIRRLFTPRRGQKVIVETDGSRPVKVSLYGAARSHGVHDPSFKVVEVTFSPETSTINLTLFEERREVAVPLHFHFLYKPSMGFAPIHEVSEDRNTRIKQFYWKLWFGDNETLPEIGLRDSFTGPEVTIDEDDVETFCAVVGNQGEAFKSARNEIPLAPMDFAIVTGWQVRCESIQALLLSTDYRTF